MVPSGFPTKSSSFFFMGKMSLQKAYQTLRLSQGIETWNFASCGTPKVCSGYIEDQFKKATSAESSMLTSLPELIDRSAIAGYPMRENAALMGLQSSCFLVFF